MLSKVLARRSVRALPRGGTLALSQDKAWAPWGFGSLVEGCGAGAASGFLMKSYSASIDADGAAEATGKDDGGLGDRNLVLGDGARLGSDAILADQADPNHHFFMNSVQDMADLCGRRYYNSKN